MPGFKSVKQGRVAKKEDAIVLHTRRRAMLAQSMMPDYDVLYFGEPLSPIGRWQRVFVFHTAGLDSEEDEMGPLHVWFNKLRYQKVRAKGEFYRLD